MTGFADIDRLDDDRDHETLRRRSVMGTMVTFGAQGARFVIQFGSQVLLANLLTPADFGLVAMVTPLLYLVQVFNELGLMQATVQREEITKAQLTALFWINMLVSAVLAGVMMAAAPLVSWAYGEPRLTNVTLALACVIILSGLSAQHMALLTRRMRLFALSFIDVTCIATASLAGLIAAWFGAHYWALVIMQAVNMAAIAFLGRLFSGFKPGLPRRDVPVGSLLRFGKNIAGHNIVTFAGYSMPSVMIGLCYNTVLLGLYDRSFRLVVVPLGQMNIPLERVGTALLSRLRTTPDKFSRAYYLMVQLFMLVTAPGFAWAAATSGILVPGMLGMAWTGAVPIVFWLALSMIPGPITLSTYWVFVSQNRSRDQFRNSLVRNVLIILSVFAGLAWGPVGVALSAACFSPFIAMIAIHGVTRQGPVTIGGMARTLYPVLLGAAVAFLVVEAIVNERAGIHLSGIARLVVSLPLSYLACALVVVCTPSGLTMVREVLNLRSTLRPVADVDRAAEA